MVKRRRVALWGRGGDLGVLGGCVRMSWRDDRWGRAYLFELVEAAAETFHL